MPGTLTPAQMFDHELNPVKGWPSMAALDKKVTLDTGVIGVVAGCGLQLNPATGKALLGTTNGAMGLFAFQGQNEFDVNGDVGNFISGAINCLVATGAYELESTEYSGLAFAPNDPLTLTVLGKLTVTTFAGLENIVGVISDAGPITNAYGSSVIRFWPVYCPARCCTDSSSSNVQ